MRFKELKDYQQEFQKGMRKMAEQAIQDIAQEMQELEQTNPELFDPDLFKDDQPKTESTTPLTVEDLAKTWGIALSKARKQLEKTAA